MAEHSGCGDSDSWGSIELILGPMFSGKER